MTLREHEAGVPAVAGQVDSSYGEEAAPPAAPRPRRVIRQGMTILKLRRKLGDPPVVLTEPGVGYRIP